MADERTLLDLLDQREVWIDKEKVTHRIDEMPGRYALNVYQYLTSRASTIGFHYSLKLCTVRLPDEHTAAFDMVMDDIERTQERISKDALGWIKDMPLLKALVARVAVDRIERQVVGYSPTVELPKDFKPYEAPEFTMAPEADFDAETYGNRPGDAGKLFVVRSGAYEDREVEAIFVGNRLAAYQYEAEANRYRTGYNQADVEEWDDHNHPEEHGAHDQVRRYRTAWTEVEFRTLVNLETSKVLSDPDPSTRVRHDVDPQMVTEKEAEGLRGQFNVFVKTTGPDYEIETLRLRHAHAVNTIRANVLADITKDMP